MLIENNKSITWPELKNCAVKYGAKIDKSDPYCESINFGLLEFNEEGIVSWYGDIICPVLKYDQMKTIIQAMFQKNI